MTEIQAWSNNLVTEFGTYHVFRPGRPLTTLLPPQILHERSKNSGNLNDLCRIVSAAVVTIIAMTLQVTPNGGRITTSGDSKLPLHRMMMVVAKLKKLKSAPNFKNIWGPNRTRLMIFAIPSTDNPDFLDHPNETSDHRL